MHTERDLLSLFYEATQRTPDNIAVDHEDGTLTYAELNGVSTIFSQQLKTAGVREDTCVILVTAHGTRNIVSILGILKCGACYVPVDRDTWSTQRIETVISTLPDDSLIVNTTSTAFQHESPKTVEFRNVAQYGPASALAARQSVLPSSDACMIFTSGSTGTPKGVILPHRAIANYATTGPFNMNVRSGDRVLHILSVAFDASTGMLFSILCNSGTVVPATMNDLYDKAVTCTILASTPSILSSLPIPSPERRLYPKVHTVLLGGETPPLDLLKGWMSIGTRILNAYGPTEATTACTMQVVEIDEASQSIRSSIIGKGMAQCPVYLLDADDEEITQDDVDGELVVSGCCLAKGYYKNPLKTAAAFVEWKGRRVYRTGDLARWARGNDGSRVLDFRGRKDRTVKNRGFLVNLETDVEMVMQQLYPGIESVHARIVDKLLVALVVPGTLDAGGLRERMSEQLSVFHVPDRILAVDRLPLSPNGKIDPRQVEELVRSLEESPLLESSESDDNTSTSDGGTSSLSDIVGHNMASALQLPFSRLRGDQDFFSLGGNSLSALKLASLCRSQGIKISPRDIYTERTWNSIAARASRTDKPASSNRRASLAPTGESGPLTPQQLTLCMPTMEWPGKNCNQLRKTYSSDHAKAVKFAWTRLWEVEPLFRTEISFDEDLGQQNVRSNPNHALHDFTCDTREEYNAAAREASLDVGLQTRIDLIGLRCANDPRKTSELTVIFTAHHSMLDGYSLAILLAKVESAIRGELPMPSAPFPAAARSLITMQRERDEEARAFWSEYLDGVPSSAALELKSGRVARGAMAQETRFDLEEEAQALASMARSHNTTLATVYYTAWALVVSARTNQLKVAIGAVYSGRQDLLEHVDAVGQLMSNLPLVVKLNPNATVADQLKQVMLDLARCAEYSWSTFEQTGNYHTTSLVAMQNDFPEYEEAAPALDTQYFENTDFPLSLLVDRNANFRLVGQYTEAAMTELAMEYRMALRRLLVSETIGSCLLASSSEQRKNDRAVSRREETRQPGTQTYAAPTTGATLASAFEQSVDLHRDLVAVEGPDTTLTYSQLETLSNGVAHEILRLCPDADTIAIYADGSTEWIVGILGILKAGCAYCPIDPAYPDERRANVFTRSGSAAIVVPRKSQAAEGAALGTNVTTIIVEECEKKTGVSVSRPSIYVEPSSDALVVFTSGTTGQPKGVPISHRGLLALQSNPEATMFSRPALRIAQYMSPAFDYCSNEIFSALLHGATLVLRDPQDINQHLKRADAVTITPSVLAVLDPDDYPNLRVVYATGEPVSPALVTTWGSGRLFINAYGPAECSICTSFTRLVPQQPVTIGRPIKTARMYVLDSDLQQLGSSQQGEIFLAGCQVMRKYIGADEVQQKKVMPDPWFPGERMYRTGDYGLWNDDGNLVYIGRTDRQVKIRGYRVELPAVEQKIYDLDSAVALSVALVANDNLVAFVKPQNIDTDALRRKLTTSLQPSWVPSKILAMDHFPTTPNRKVDMRALEQLAIRGPAEAKEQQVPIQTGLEESIATLWRAILKLDDCTTLAASDNFLDLGGNSVLQMLLAVRLSKTFGVPVSVREVITTAELGAQATMIVVKKGAVADVLEHSAPPTTLDVHQLTPLERQAWFQYHVGTSRTTFNIPVVLHLRGSFDRTKLEHALNSVLETRTVLRSNFIVAHGTPIRVLRHRAPRVRVLEKLDIQAELATPFEVGRDELIRVFLCRNTLMVIASHMIADLDSVQVFLRHVSRIYNGEPVGQPRFYYLKSPTWSYKVTKAEKEYWMTNLKGLPETVPVAKTNAQNSLFEGKSIQETYSGPLIEQLQDLMKRNTVTQHQLVSTAIAQTLQWLWQTDDVVLGCPYANRHSEQDRDSCGLFLERLPLRIRSSSHDSCEDLLRATRDVSQKALGNALPFHELLALLNLAPSLNRHPLFQTMVTFHPRNILENCLDIPGCTVTREACHPPGAKFLLMFEWTEMHDDEWALRTEYNSTRIEAKQIDSIRRALGMTLSALAAGQGRREIEQTLTERLVRPRQAYEPHARREMVTSTIRREMAACLEVEVKDIPAGLSFFEAGSDSINACALQSRLRRVGLDVSIRDIFDTPTAEGLARLLVG